MQQDFVGIARPVSTLRSIYSSWGETKDIGINRRDARLSQPSKCQGRSARDSLDQPVPKCVARGTKIELVVNKPTTFNKTKDSTIFGNEVAALTKAR